MEMAAFPRLLVTATGSHTGKTTTTLALLAAFRRLHLKVQSYKCGPDYIDPMYHTAVTQCPTYHTDPFFLSAAAMQTHFCRHSRTAELSILEGAMGFYDGIGTTSECSAYTVSEWLQTPVILLVSPKGMGCSVGAICSGFLHFRKPNRIAGILLQQIQPGMYPYYKEIIERECGIPVFGYLPVIPEATLESRHLGLYTAEETEHLAEIITILAETAKNTIDLQALLTLAQTAPPLPIPAEKKRQDSAKPTVRIGIARDSAFSFYYAENLELLEENGAELVYFSPLSDETLPESLDGLYFGGGYPECYMEALAKNHSFLGTLRSAAAAGIPIFAECGGFLYLQATITDTDGKLCPMAGVLPGNAVMGKRLCRFGYITVTAQKATILGEAGTTCKAHEFHYADSDTNGEAVMAERPNGKRWNAIQATETIAAGFPHWYFPSNPAIPRHFVKVCRNYQQRRTEAT